MGRRKEEHNARGEWKKAPRLFRSPSCARQQYGSIGARSSHGPPAYTYTHIPAGRSGGYTSLSKEVREISRHECFPSSARRGEPHNGPTVHLFDFSWARQLSSSSGIQSRLLGCDADPPLKGRKITYAEVSHAWENRSLDVRVGINRETYARAAPQSARGASVMCI